MTSLNYVQPKSSRNRFSLFLQLSAQKKLSQSGISSESYFASTPTTVGSMEPCTPTSSIVGSKGLSRVNSASSPVLPRSPMRMNTDEPIPLTSNELDAKEKARLLKKARKLSRVFGEMPDLQRTSSSSYGQSKTPGHRRSTSTHASDSELSSRQQTARKFSSQSDLASSSDSGSRIEAPDRKEIPPVPSLPPRESIDASFEHTSAQQRKQLPLHILTRPKPLADDVRALLSPSPSTPRVYTEDVQKRRLMKPRRELGEDKLKNTISRELKTRKSYDSSVIRVSPQSDEAASNRPLHRSRSLSANKKKRLGGIDSAVEFHLRTVQTSGNTNWIQVSEGVKQDVESSPSPLLPPPEIVQTQHPDSDTLHSTTSVDAETRRISMLSATSLRDCGTPSILDVEPPLSPAVSVHSVESQFPDSTQEENFRERRRRAAKLTQFFGVDYHDITASMPVTGHALEPVQPVQPVHSIAPTEKWEARMEPSVQVGVRTNTRRFWGGRGNLKEAEVGDVIPKLRELRAS